jgi:hypothetical protein
MEIFVEAEDGVEKPETDAGFEPALATPSPESRVGC